MKNHTNTLQNKKYNLWLKGIIALSLSIALQSDMCGGSGKSGGSNGTEIQDYNALYRAIKFQKDPKMVQDLLNDGIDCNNISRSASSESKGKNSLLLALELKNKKIVEILLKQDKIAISRKDKDTTALHLAILNEWEDIANELITKLCELQNLNSNTGNAMVEYKEKFANEQLANYTLSSKDKEDNTPLHLAIQKKLKKVVTKLIENLPIEAFILQDAKGRNVFHLAARSNNQDLFKALFKKIAPSKATIHSILFAKDGKDGQGRTVFARAYLPEHANVSVLSFNASDFKMFEYILTTTKDCLSKEELTNIYNEIEQYSSRLKPDYKLKLQGIVSQGILGVNTNTSSTLPETSWKIGAAAA